LVSAVLANSEVDWHLCPFLASQYAHYLAE
jgi:hypothetical protein